MRKVTKGLLVAGFAALVMSAFSGERVPHGLNDSPVVTLGEVNDLSPPAAAEMIDYPASNFTATYLRTEAPVTTKPVATLSPVSVPDPTGVVGGNTQLATANHMKNDDRARALNMIDDSHYLKKTNSADYARDAPEVVLLEHRVVDNENEGLNIAATRPTDGSGANTNNGWGHRTSATR